MNTANAKKLAKTHPKFAALVRDIGVIELKPRRKTAYEALMTAIAYQQLHGKAAATILARFCANFAGKGFPKAHDVLKLPLAKFRAAGFSESKTKALRDIAQKQADGFIPSSRKLNAMRDEDIISHLTQLRGVGRWTVEMYLIFTLCRPDVWPVDDFGVRKGWQVLFGKKDMPTAKQLKELGAPFMGYRSTAALYLWRAADRAKEEAKLATKAKVKNKLKKK